VWSRQILWGSHRLTGGIMKPSANAWANTVVWGSAKTMATTGDNIVWGSMALTGDNIVWGSSTSGDNVVWGTSFVGDNIVWGSSATGDNIVWGSDCAGADCDNTVWGTSDGDNIVWGSCSSGDNIVWGSSLGDNIVWGTADDDVADTPVFSDDATEPVPSVEIEFGDTLPLVPDTTTTPDPLVTPVVGTLGSIGGL
jgi:hypothetical protein